MIVLIFILVLAVIIFVHELGHFTAAKLFGVRVDAFKIGFGPKIVAWTRGETEYGVNWVLFGGYVKIHGEDGAEHDPRSFASKPRYAQAIMLASGVLFNFIFAWLLYAVVFASGVTVSTADFMQYADRFRDERIIVTYVLPGSPAEKAGLKEGDAIAYVETTAMNVERGKISTPTDLHKGEETIADIQNIVNDYGGRPVGVEYVRDGHHQTIGVMPVPGIVEGKYAIGISMDNVADLRLPPWSAAVEGTKYVVTIIRDTFVGIWGFVTGLVSGHSSLGEVTGPVGIYEKLIVPAAELGFVYILMVTALISVNLGAINLVPFPALDGWRILFVAIEGAMRRRLPVKAANWLNAIGFGLLILLMIMVTWRDVMHLFG